MRARTSFWKPFITDSTTISAATPSAMPSIEISEMKEMKWLRRLARGVAQADEQFVGECSWSDVRRIADRRRAADFDTVAAPR